MIYLPIHHCLVKNKSEKICILNFGIFLFFMYRAPFLEEIHAVYK